MYSYHLRHYENYVFIYLADTSIQGDLQGMYTHQQQFVSRRMDDTSWGIETLTLNLVDLVSFFP